MAAPQRIGVFPIERELGRGGMGIVYLGRDLKLGRSVAIKVLPDAFATDPERLSRFEREAKLLASLNHPHIAAIYGLEESDGIRCLVLEYVEGDTLAERIAKGALPLDEALEIGRQIAAALEAAHESGVIHRDLKPGNVKLTTAGDVKVLDFGLAKGAGTAESSPDLSQSPTMAYAATGVGVILGTAAYMSPEQARGRVVDRRTDIWSLGCVLYECLTGRQLFGGETVTDTIAKILERDPDWSALPAQLPEKIRELLRRCLEKDPRKRLRDVGDARLELEEAIAARSSKSRVAHGSVETASRARGRAPALAYGVAIAALAVAAFVVLRPMLARKPSSALRLTVAEPEGANLLGDAVECALSPDGRTLAFVATDSSGTVQIWSRSLELLGGRPIPGTENASRPFWSADSRWIAFFADGKLKKVRLGGGAETVCEAPNGRGGSWSPQGTIVFAPTGEGPLFAVKASGGEPHQVTTLDTTLHVTGHRFPCFLPDGKHFLYVALPSGPRGCQVMAGSIEGGKDRPILIADSAPVYASPGYLLFLRDRNLVAQGFDPGSMRLQGEPVTLPDTPAGSNNSAPRAATVSSDGTLAYMNGASTNNKLVWFDRSGREVGTVPIPPAQYFLPNLSPDDRVVAVTRILTANESDLWLVDLARGVSTRFTYGPQANQLGVWSRDGSRIAFESSRNGTYDIFLKPSSGVSRETPLVLGRSQFKHPASWSPDDHLLAFAQMDQGTGFDIWLAPTNGSDPPVPYLQSPFHEQNPDFSPDGHWMLYDSDESGRQEIYVQSFPTPGRKYQVTTGGGAFGFWRRDGKEIFALASDGQSMLSAEVLESGATFRTGPPRTLFRVPPNVFGIAIAHDGQRFLVAVPEGKAKAPSITVVLNWKAALAARGADRP